VEDYRYFPKQFRQDAPVIPEHLQAVAAAPVNRGKRFPLLLLFALTLSICGVVLIALKVLAVLAR
jgi:hypothetical protein